MHNALDRFEIELHHGLRPVTAPAELWDRVELARMPESRVPHRSLVWALAMAVVLAAVALSWVCQTEATSRLQAFSGELRCQNPAQIRAWVRAKTGLDLPLRAELPPTIQLIGVRKVSSGVELDYRTANRDAALLVSRADGRASNVAHNRSAVGPLFTLACDRPADLRLACQLCHLD